ncbi:immediate early response 3-interacting protein 1 isoform X2 [Phyllobates terribilis]|uniref:immediate early response 3-interacting protein 1 isoform X2 n=1 Tax=Phyllobates terribilis TaxID=111132 RepID=UPI003CCAB280
MAFTLYSLLQAALLCVNAVAVLHEERFLSKSESCRWLGRRSGDWRFWRRTRSQVPDDEPCALRTDSDERSPVGGHTQ